MIDMSCPKHEGDHEWASWRVDPRRSCIHCGRPGRDNKLAGETGGFFQAATAARADLFSGLEQPASVKVWKGK